METDDSFSTDFIDKHLVIVTATTRDAHVKKGQIQTFWRWMLGVTRCLEDKNDTCQDDDWQ